MKSKKSKNFEKGERFLGVDVVLNDIPNNPQCSHGPSILFKKNFSDGEAKEFFSCSACRDRKRCSFYIEAEAKIHDKHKSNVFNNNGYSITRHKQCYDTLNGNKNEKKSIEKFCATCTCYFGGTGKSVDKNKHEKCLIFSDIHQKLRRQPSKFLTLREDPKCEAQYLFSDDTVHTIVDLVKQLKLSKVICVGSPRIHEKLLIEPFSTDCQSLLMDFDERFMHFFPPENFVYYNLFNHHFFGGDAAKDIFSNFLTDRHEEIVVVIDPPFGGRMELIGNTLQTIEKEWRIVNKLPPTSSLPMMLVFPYFLEKVVKSALPDFNMLEYMVDYDNHPLYTNEGSKAMKHGSAVRIFTNMKANLFQLPEESYKNCAKCDRWVYQENVHCDICGGCMGKDGRGYKHCDPCAKCVKPSWVHCNACNTCQQQDHKCEGNKNGSRVAGCWVCKGDDHKMTNCPNRKRKCPKQETKKVKKMHLNSSEEKSRNFDIINQLLSKR